MMLKNGRRVVLKTTAVVIANCDVEVVMVRTEQYLGAEKERDDPISGSRNNKACPYRKVKQDGVAKTSFSVAAPMRHSDLAEGGCWLILQRRRTMCQIGRRRGFEAAESILTPRRRRRTFVTMKSR